MAGFWSYVASDKTDTCDYLFKVSRNERTTGDAYGLLIDVDDVLAGAGATGPRSYGVGISGNKTSGVLTTTGCDDALLRIVGNNYVANGEIYNFRGLNCCVNNRNGGIVGALENLISVSAKSGSVQSKILGLSVDAQSLTDDTGDEFGGLDVSLNREGGVNTKEYGIKIRTRGTIGAAIETPILIEQGATDYGFSVLFKVDAASTVGITSAASVTTSHKIPFKVGSTTYYIPCGTVTS